MNTQTSIAMIASECCYLLAQRLRGRFRVSSTRDGVAGRSESSSIGLSNATLSLDIDRLAYILSSAIDALVLKVSAMAETGDEIVFRHIEIDGSVRERATATHWEGPSLVVNLHRDYRDGASLLSLKVEYSVIARGGRTGSRERSSRILASRDLEECGAAA